MNRRGLLASASVTSIGVLAGCLGAQARKSPSIGGGTVYVAAGEEATLHLSARAVSAIGFERVPAAETVTFDLDGATLAPSPTERDDSPPRWRWDTARSSVELSVPVRAAADASPGEYAYAVTVWGDDRDDAAVTKEHTITVADAE